MRTVSSHFMALTDEAKEALVWGWHDNSKIEKLIQQAFAKSFNGGPLDVYCLERGYENLVSWEAYDYYWSSSDLGRCFSPTIAPKKLNRFMAEFGLLIKPATSGGKLKWLLSDPEHRYIEYRDYKPRWHPMILQEAMNHLAPSYRLITPTESDLACSGKGAVFEWRGTDSPCLYSPSLDCVQFDTAINADGLLILLSGFEAVEAAKILAEMVGPLVKSDTVDVELINYLTGDREVQTVPPYNSK